MHLTDFVFNLINGLANKVSLLDSLIVFLSKTIPYILIAATILTFLLGILKKNKQYRGVAIDTVIKTTIAYLVSQTIGSIFYLPRPFVNNSEVNLLYPHEANASFPSDHALGSMSIALGLNKLCSNITRVYILLAIGVGLSRIYVGHHYPLDVLGGYLIAFIIGALYDKVLSVHIQKIYFSIEKIFVYK